MVSSQASKPSSSIAGQLEDRRQDVHVDVVEGGLEDRPAAPVVLDGVQRITPVRLALLLPPVHLADRLQPGAGRAEPQRHGVRKRPAIRSAPGRSGRPWVTRPVVTSGRRREPQRQAVGGEKHRLHRQRRDPGRRRVTRVLEPFRQRHQMHRRLVAAGGSYCRKPSSWVSSAPSSGRPEAPGCRRGERAAFLDGVRGRGRAARRADRRDVRRRSGAGSRGTGQRRGGDAPAVQQRMVEAEDQVDAAGRQQVRPEQDTAAPGRRRSGGGGAARCAPAPRRGRRPGRAVRRSATSGRRATAGVHDLQRLGEAAQVEGGAQRRVPGDEPVERGAERAARARASGPCSGRRRGRRPAASCSALW